MSRSAELKFDFPPDLSTVRDIYTHKPELLLTASGLKVVHQRELDSNPRFAVNWAVVKDWSEGARYSATISKAEADNLYSAVTARRNGVLSWVKKWW